MPDADNTCRYCGIDRRNCCCCCGSDCPYIDQDDAPDGKCEGPVEVVDEERWGEPGDYDYGWVHRCAKHAEWYHKHGY